MKLLNAMKLLITIQNLKYMSSYCLKCKKNTENINPRVLKTKNDETIILSKCAICGSKKSRFIKKKQEASGIFFKITK